MRKSIIGANWKMNLSCDEANQLYTKVSLLNKFESTVDLVVFPPQPYLALLSKMNGVALGAQNAYAPDMFGAFTGETSLMQLKDLNISSVLVGHSERRLHFVEDTDFLCTKALTALSLGIQVFFCCGESDEIRSNGNAIPFVENQLKPLLSQLNQAHCPLLVIAYEPIWAIGTGKVPTLGEIEEMHSAIRALCSHYFDQVSTDAIRIVYGGSCNATNAKSIFQLPNVDGGLVGGASLQFDSFKEIIDSI